MNPIVRTSLLMAAAAGIGGAVTWTLATRTQLETPPPAAALVEPPTYAFDANASRPAHNHAQQSTAAPITKAPAPSPQPVSPEAVARWIADATAIDPKTRADAITALAAAPKAQAVPVLRNVLTVGDPQVDRQLALDSLHVLALEQGDSDGKIRKVLRDAIYHGDDATIGQSAQSILEDIESESCLASGQNACNPAN